MELFRLTGGEGEVFRFSIFAKKNSPTSILSENAAVRLKFPTNLAYNSMLVSIPWNTTESTTTLWVVLTEGASISTYEMSLEKASCHTIAVFVPLSTKLYVRPQVLTADVSVEFVGHFGGFFFVGWSFFYRKSLPLWQPLPV